MYFILIVYLNLYTTYLSKIFEAYLIKFTIDEARFTHPSYLKHILNLSNNCIKYPTQKMYFPLMFASIELTTFQKTNGYTASGYYNNEQRVHYAVLTNIMQLKSDCFYT